MKWKRRWSGKRRLNRLVLIPIRLEDAIMQTDIAWAAHLRQKRHIGDFRDWTDHDTYPKALERLLRDLNADAAAEAVKTRPPSLNGPFGI
jgi:hypothetical protein